MPWEELKAIIRKVAVAFIVFVAAPIGAIINSQWWLVGVIALIGLVLGARALMSILSERRANAIAQAEELEYRANRQNRWVRRGDNRGIYGPEAAEIMRTIEPKLPPMPPAETPPGVEIAGIVRDKKALTKMLADKTPGWRWAAFASVLVQRRDAVRSRLRDVELGYATVGGAHARTGAEVAVFVTTQMDEMVELVKQVESFMLAPAFMGAFGSPSDENTADADDILHVANRLMDYHDRFLQMAEHTRDFETPTQYRDLIHDCAILMTAPLDGYRAFINDFVELVAEMPDIMIHGRGTVELEPIQLHMSLDDHLRKRIMKRVRAAAKS